ncbi:MAG TPA: hypothetical protein VF077_13330 [Nitrospiraceae bacterium]
MTHPRGGVKKVSNSLEEEACKLHGWTYCDASGRTEPVEAPKAAPEPVVYEHGPIQGADYDERAALIAEAERQGIHIDRRWGMERLWQAVHGKSYE